MSAKRITIGLKPTDDEPDAAAPQEQDATAVDVNVLPERLGLVSARAAGAKSAGPSAEAWVRRGSEAPVDREATGDAEPANALARLTNVAPAATDKAKPAEPATDALAHPTNVVPAATADPKPAEPAVDALRLPTNVAPAATGDAKPVEPTADALPRLTHVALAVTSDAKPAETIAKLQVPTAHEAATDASAAVPLETPPAGRMPAVPALLISAAAGAVVAALVAILIFPLFAPSIESRLGPIADRVAAVEGLVEATGRNVGELNNEVAQAIDADNAIATRVGEQAAALTEIRGQLDLDAARAIRADVDPSLFAVAAAQLRWAFYTGRPFEAELVNVYGMVRNDEHFSGLMNELSSPARTGLPNAALLRQHFRAYVAAAGLVIGGPKTYLEYGMSILDQYAGLSNQPYDVELGNVAATDADRKLMNGDVNGAVQALAGLDPALVAVLQPWLTTARIYVRAESTIAELTTAAVNGLRQRIEVPDAG